MELRGLDEERPSVRGNPKSKDSSGRARIERRPAERMEGCAYRWRW